MDIEHHIEHKFVNYDNVNEITADVKKQDSKVL